MAHPRDRAALVRDTRGANLVEYMVILGLVAVVVLAGYRTFGSRADIKAQEHAACVESLACGKGSVVTESAMPELQTGAQAIKSDSGDGGGKSIWTRALDVGKGIVVDGVWGTVTGLWEVVTHPIKTVEGLWFAVSHPIKTVTAIKDSIVTAWHENPERVIGQGIFEIVTLPVAALKATKVTKIAEVSKVARIAEKAEKVGEAAKLAEKAAEAAKVAEKAGDAAKVAEKAGDAAKAAEKAGDAAKAAEKAETAGETAKAAAATTKKAEELAATQKWADDLAGKAPKVDAAAIAEETRAYQARKAQVKSNYEAVMRGEAEPPPGITRERLKLAVEGDATGQRVPLTFKSPEQFSQFQSELKAILESEGITDATIQQVGSATTGWRGNPLKEIAPWKASSDSDFAVFSQQALEQARAIEAPANTKIVQGGKYTVLKNSDGTTGFYHTPLGEKLDGFAKRWNKEIYGNPNVDGFDFKLNLDSKPFQNGSTVVGPGGVRAP